MCVQAVAEYKMRVRSSSVIDGLILERKTSLYVPYDPFYINSRTRKKFLEKEHLESIFLYSYGKVRRFSPHSKFNASIRLSVLLRTSFKKYLNVRLFLMKSIRQLQ